MVTSCVAVVDVLRFDKPKSLLLELELACLYIPGDGDVFGL